MLIQDPYEDHPLILRDQPISVSSANIENSEDPIRNHAKFKLDYPV